MQLSGEYHPRLTELLQVTPDNKLVFNDSLRLYGRAVALWAMRKCEGRAWPANELPLLGKLPHAHLSGSCITSGEGNDLDIVIYQNRTIKFDNFMDFQAEGYELCGAESYESCGTFIALRKGPINLILTDDPVWYSGMQSAVEVCKWLKATYNIDTRADRVAVFGMCADGAEFNV